MKKSDVNRTCCLWWIKNGHILFCNYFQQDIEFIYSSLEYQLLLWLVLTKGMWWEWEAWGKDHPVIPQPRPHPLRTRMSRDKCLVCPAGCTQPNWQQKPVGIYLSLFRSWTTKLSCHMTVATWVTQAETSRRTSQLNPSQIVDPETYEQIMLIVLNN